MAARPATLARRTGLATRLLDLAEAGIAEHGLASLRVRTLAEAAACSIGAIYVAYPDLDELVLAVNRRTLDQIDAVLATAPAGVATGLVPLALAYLDYAIANRPRWTALFQHRMAGDAAVPAWYAERRQAAFHPVADQLATLRPDLDDAARAELARGLFAAVHGVVALGLDELLGAMPLPALRNQVTQVTQALIRGLLPHDGV